MLWLYTVSICHRLPLKPINPINGNQPLRRLQQCWPSLLPVSWPCPHSCCVPSGPPASSIGNNLIYVTLNVPGLHLHQTSSSRWPSAASRSAASAVSHIPRNLGFHSCQHPPVGTAASATCHHTVVLNLPIDYSYQSYSVTIIKVTKNSLTVQHHYHRNLNLVPVQLIQTVLFLSQSHNKTHYKLLLSHMRYVPASLSFLV